MRAERQLVKLYCENRLTYYGGGERVILTLSNYLTEKGLSAEIVENCHFAGEGRVSDDFIKSVSKVPIKCGPYIRFGVTNFFSCYFPSLGDMSRSSISLIFVRRVPPISYLKSLEAIGDAVIFCLHGIGLENLRPTNPLIMIHQLVIRHQLDRLSKHVRSVSGAYVQVLTKGMEKYLKVRGIPAEKIFLIENGEPSSVLPGINDDFFQVIFIGRIEKTIKGIRRLRKVIERSKITRPNIRFVIVGSGNDEDMLDDLPSNAHYLKFVDDIRKREELLKSNLMIVTSNIEPFSLVTIEGLLYGVPVVTTPVSGPSSIVTRDTLFGRVSTFRPGDLVSAIDSYYSIWEKDRTRYSKLRADISRRAREFYSDKVMGDNYIKMIREIQEMRNSQ